LLEGEPYELPTGHCPETGAEQSEEGELALA